MPDEPTLTIPDCFEGSLNCFYAKAYGEVLWVSHDGYQGAFLSAKGARALKAFLDRFIHKQGRRDDGKTQQCASCGETKPLSEYRIYPGARGPARIRCQECHAAKKTAYNKQYVRKGAGGEG